MTMLIVTDEVRIPLSEFQWTFVRSSGPGGQNVNKVASKAVMRWAPAASGLIPEEDLLRLKTLFPALLTKEGEIIITSQRTRDAVQNRADCLEKLRRILLSALKKPKRRIPTRPTQGSIRRRLDDKARNARKKQDRKKNIFRNEAKEQ